jgi:hypothetical protein
VAELRLPTLQEVDKKALKWRQHVINLNVKKVAEVMNSKNLQGLVALEWVRDTMSTPENILACILDGLNRLENHEMWYFKTESDWIDDYLHFSNHPFPEEKPWWKFWI